MECRYGTFGDWLAGALLMGGIGALANPRRALAMVGAVAARFEFANELGIVVDRYTEVSFLVRGEAFSPAARFRGDSLVAIYPAEPIAFRLFVRKERRIP